MNTTFETLCEIFQSQPPEHVEKQYLKVSPADPIAKGQTLRSLQWHFLFVQDQKNFSYRGMKMELQASNLLLLLEDPGGNLIGGLRHDLDLLIL